MFHCHNLMHEDRDMLRAFSVVDTNLGVAGRRSTADRFQVNGFSNTVYTDYKYADPEGAITNAVPELSAPALGTSLLQDWLDKNIYRIFYPTSDDKDLYAGFTNPWESSWCPVASPPSPSPPSPPPPV
jgi:hypothetical protein